MPTLPTMTHPPTRSTARALAAVLLAGATIATTFAVAQGGQPAAPASTGGQAAPAHGGPAHGGRIDRASAEMHRSMSTGLKQMQAMQPSGDVDRDFATMMRVHHQQAVEMARVQIEHGRSPEMVALAREIVEAQQKEITRIDRWLASRR